jgi:endonuclease/exonuclease/phosphatase family metal-dependent hydrolase
MKLALCALLATGCASLDETPQPWVPAEQIAAPFTPELGTAPTAAVPRTLRIASWNVERATDPAAIARAIATSPVIATADVILIQEIEHHPNEPASRAAQIASTLGMAWFYAPARIAGDGTHGDAIFSRFPLRAPEVKRLPVADQPISSSRRIAQRTAIDLGTRTLTLVNVHLDTRLSAVDRIRQLHPAISDSPHDALVGGDLNTLPWIWVESAVPLTSTEAIVGQDQAQVIDDYLQALGYVTPLVHDADTHDTPFDMRLDALCPRGFAVLAAGVDYDTTASDHYPVWIDIAL